MKSLFEKLYFVLVFVEITGIVTRVFGEGGSASDAALGHTTNPVLMGFVALVGVGTLYYAYPKIPIIWRMLLQLKWTFLLYLWMILSIFWTETRSITFYGALRMVVYLVSAAFFGLRLDTDALLLWLSRCFVVAAVLSVPGQYLLGEAIQDDGVGWGGIFPHKNWLGFCMMTAISTILVQRRGLTLKPRLIRVGALLICTALLFLSQSYTAILSTIVTASFVFFRRSRFKSKAFVPIFIVGTFCVLLMLSNPLQLILAAGGKSASFTGRDAVWAFSLKGIAQSPILGHGYGAFWADSNWTLGLLHWSPPHAHNGVLQVSLDLGLVGLILTLGLLASAWRRALRIERYSSSSAALWMLTLLVMIFVHNLTEADLMLFDLLWYLLMIGSFALLRLENALLHTGSMPQQSEQRQTALIGV